MSKGPIILLLFAAYIFVPMLTEWVYYDGTRWYRPYIIWAIVIAIAYGIQRRSRSHDA